MLLININVIEYKFVEIFSENLQQTKINMKLWASRECYKSSLNCSGAIAISEFYHLTSPN